MPNEYGRLYQQFKAAYGMLKGGTTKRMNKLTCDKTSGDKNSDDYILGTTDDLKRGEFTEDPQGYKSTRKGNRYVCVSTDKLKTLQNIVSVWKFRVINDNKEIVAKRKDMGEKILKERVFNPSWLDREGLSNAKHDTDDYNCKLLSMAFSMGYVNKNKMSKMDFAEKISKYKMVYGIEIILPPALSVTTN